LDKICRIIRECPYSVHDISRTELDAGSGLPRFNMPFELGLVLGAKRFGGRALGRKKTLIFDGDPTAISCIFPILRAKISMSIGAMSINLSVS
jgi:hypothetical protein